ncbi:MAG: DsbA family oxidoreductase [Chitinophagaceae bacterium]|nr:MAG: DsbA family oxidoreductase [Chitinophagaceae bacterium]
MVNKKTKMQVEVWSDIMCPFCYIGKRNFEAGLAQFCGRDDVELVWKSFQLNPSIKKSDKKDLNVYQYVADMKGISYEQSVKMHEAVVQTAKNAGLDYHFEKAAIANSFNAHRLIQKAKTRGLGDAAEERLFYANFTEGKDYGDTAVLQELGKEIGLSSGEVEEALTDQKYADMVDHDINEARQIGVNGVPFFVFDRKYAVSGAQPPKVFTQTLDKAFEEFETAANF